MKIKLAALFLALCLAFPLLLGGCMGEVEQTNESLTIYFDPQAREFIAPAVEAFTRDYLGMKFSIYDPTGGDETMSAEQIQMKINTELMSGNGGADLFIMDCGVGKFGKGSGRYAPIKSGAFCDLNPFLENDPAYDPEEYYQDILDVGIYRDKRYIMPLNYFQHILLGSESALRESGFDISRCTTAEGFRQEAERYLSQPDSVPLWEESFFLSHFIPGMIDQREGKAHLLEEKYRPWLELWKTNVQKVQEKGVDDTMGPYQKVRAGKVLFNPIQSTRDMLKRIHFVDDPVFLPLLNADGTQTASVGCYAGICNTSPNQENAYHFLRYLIGAEAQTNHLYNALPVLKGAEKAIEMEYRQWIGQRRWQYNYKGERVEEQVRTARPQDFYDSMWEMLLTNPRTVCFDDREWAKQVYSYMRPFYEGTASYEDCAQKAQEQMETYLSQ